MPGAFWIGRLVFPTGDLWLFATGAWNDDGVWADYATWPIGTDEDLGGMLLGGGVI